MNHVLQTHKPKLLEYQIDEMCRVHLQRLVLKSRLLLPEGSSEMVNVIYPKCLITLQFCDG